MKSPSYYALLFTLAIFVQSPASASSNRTAGVCPSAAVRIVGTTDPELTGADLQAMCSVINDEASPQATARVSPALDWENAFGIRYTDLKKRDAFYAQIVKPLQTSDTDTTLEIKIRALAPGVAVADEYWHIVGQLDTTTRKPGPDRWGRTTYVFVKDGGTWTNVLERVADLRSPYYQHFDVLPAPFAVSPQLLDQWAGRYALPGGKGLISLSRTGATFDVERRGEHFTGIPVSNTEVLMFEPDDLAEYYRITFGASGPVLSDDARDFEAPLTKQQ
jgi:hypothetical protein